MDPATPPIPTIHRAALACLALCAGAATTGRAEEEERLHFVMDSVRVFYSVEGESAVPPDDRDGNGVPDRVEDVARQVWAARAYFCGVLGFPDPYAGERFGGANCLQVSLHHPDRIGGLNGVAYRRAQRARAIPEGKPDDRALVVAVSTTVDPLRNATPAHEFFHLVQYGATYFGNGWFLEGMARWAESPWRMESADGATALSPPRRWPLPEDQRSRIFAMRYEAGAVLWKPIARLAEEQGADRRDEISLPAALKALTYSDGSLVLRAPAIPGATVMREILAELGAADDRAQKKLGHEEWTLPLQNAAENDPFLHDAVLAVLRRHRLVR